MPTTRSVNSAELEKKRVEAKEKYREKWESAVKAWASDMAREEHTTIVSSFDPREEEGKSHAELRKALIVRITHHVLSDVKTHLLGRYDQVHRLVGLEDCLSNDWLTAYTGQSIYSSERQLNRPEHINFKLDLHPDVPAKNVRAHSDSNMPLKFPWERQLSLLVSVQSQGSISPGTKTACLTAAVLFEPHTLSDALAEIKLGLWDDPTFSAEVKDSIDALPGTYWDPLNWWSSPQGASDPENFCVGVALAANDREDLSSYLLYGYGWYFHPSGRLPIEDVSLPLLTEHRRGSSSAITRSSEILWQSDFDGSTETLVDADEEDRNFVD